LDWIYFAINALLIIWVASLQIKSSKSEDKDSYDPVRIIKESSKNIVDSVKPFVIYILLGIGAVTILYYEFMDDGDLTKFLVFKISFLSAILAISISSIISTWYKTKLLELLLQLVRGVGDAFNGK
jgi:uncharacterized membrane protein